MPVSSARGSSIVAVVRVPVYRVRAVEPARGREADVRGFDLDDRSAQGRLRSERGTPERLVHGEREDPPETEADPRQGREEQHAAEPVLMRRAARDEARETGRPLDEQDAEPGKEGAVRGSHRGKIRTAAGRGQRASICSGLDRPLLHVRAREAGVAYVVTAGCSL